MSEALEQLRISEQLNMSRRPSEIPMYADAIRKAILELDDRLKALEDDKRFA